MSASKILFIMTGSIASYKACAVLSKLKQNGHDIQVVMSPSSLHFVGPSTIEGLTGRPPATDMYADGHAMEHIHLARWADLIVAAPATAHYINRIANGIGDDLLTTLFLAHDFKKPYLIAPAMNTMMYQHPTTQASISKLKNMGVEILEAASGVLACGEVGFGRLLEPDLIIQEIENRISKLNKSSSTPITNPTKSIQPGQNIKILITSGGTTEAIDDVRVITNKSTGKTAATLADQLSESGFDVTYLHSENAIQSKNSTKQISFLSFEDLKQSLQTELKNNLYAWVIHAAAVSDYSVDREQLFNGKISSEQEVLTLKLKRNPKLINLIKELSPKTKLVGFKLTSTSDYKVVLDKVNQLFQNAKCDFVVQNDWQDIKNNQRKFNVFCADKKVEATKVEGIEQLTSFLFQKLTNKNQESL